MKAYILVISTLLALFLGWLIATGELSDGTSREIEVDPAAALPAAAPLSAPGRALTATEQIEERIDRWVDERVDRLFAGEPSSVSGAGAVVLLPDLHAREWGTYLQLSARAEKHPELAARADRLAEAWLQLLDPVWGGVYARTPLKEAGPDSAVTRNVRIDKDYEKRLSDQAGALQVFAAAYRRTREARYLRAVERIDAYLLEWLADGEGLFFAGQTGVPADARQRIGVAAYWRLSSEHQRRNFGLPVRAEDRPAAANRALSEAYLCTYGVISDPNYLAVARRIEARLTDGLPQSSVSDGSEVGEALVPDWPAERALAQLPEAVDVSQPLPEGLAELALRLRLAPGEGAGCALSHQPEPQFEPLG